MSWRHPNVCSSSFPVRIPQFESFLTRSNGRNEQINAFGLKWTVTHIWSCLWSQLVFFFLNKNAGGSCVRGEDTQMLRSLIIFLGLALSVLVTTDSPEMKQKLSGKSKFQRLCWKKPHKPDPISISVDETDRCEELQLQHLRNICFYAAS